MFLEKFPHYAHRLPRKPRNLTSKPQFKNHETLTPRNFLRLRYGPFPQWRHEIKMDAIVVVQLVGQLTTTQQQP